MFINIGNKAFVNADKIKFIVGADAEKVRRELAKHGMTRTVRKCATAPLQRKPVLC